LRAVSVALFIRHGKASAFASTDYDQLSPPGVEQSEQLGEWLVEQRLAVDAVFLGPRRRHAQTHEAVTRVLGTRGVSLPDPVVLPDLDEHDGLAVVFKMLPSLAAEDPALRSIVEATVRGEKPSPDDVLAAFKRVTRRWVRGEIGHDEVEPWSTFRARIARALPRIAHIGRGKTALVFTSAGAVASAVAEALGVAEEERVLALSWSLYNGSITELDFAGDRWGLRTFNTTPHLRDKRLITSV
jgi:broad specificity phosphatase PhoE